MDETSETIREDATSSTLSTASSDTQTVELKRRGDVEKCPVCGTHVDSEAYHCATCRNYFCFHCRARLLPADTQLQCVNADCSYYGKLICGVCNAKDEKDESPVSFAEPEDGYWPALLLFALVLILILWFFVSFWWALVIAIGVYFGGGYALQRAGVNLFGRTREVEFQRKSSYYTCVCCQQPVKELSQTSN